MNRPLWLKTAATRFPEVVFDVLAVKLLYQKPQKRETFSTPAKSRAGKRRGRRLPGQGRMRNAGCRLGCLVHALGASSAPLETLSRWPGKTMIAGRSLGWPGSRTGRAGEQNRHFRDARRYSACGQRE
jgi:hypothetical protein